MISVTWQYSNNKQQHQFYPIWISQQLWKDRFIHFKLFSIIMDSINIIIIRNFQYYTRVAMRRFSISYNDQEELADDYVRSRVTLNRCYIIWGRKRAKRSCHSCLWCPCQGATNANTTAQPSETVTYSRWSSLQTSHLGMCVNWAETGTITAVPESDMSVCCSSSTGQNMRLPWTPWQSLDTNGFKKNVIFMFKKLSETV